jgi:hypothetical protein
MELQGFPSAFLAKSCSAQPDAGRASSKAFTL